MANNNVVTLVPATGLVNANPQDPTKPPLFCLFSKNWITMQAFITQTMSLPITTTDFEATYGTFADESEIEKVISAMQAIQGLSTQFGDPVALSQQLAQNPAILQGNTPPTAIYTHIVWFATKLYQAANSFQQTLSQFLTILNSVPSTQRLQTLQELLTGNGGLQSTANAMLPLCNDLIQALAGFNNELTPSVTTMVQYTAKGSTFMNDVEQDITTDIQSVETYQEAADAAFKEWRDYTIAATTTSIGVLVLSCGMAWPASVALAAGLGDAAAKARKAYDNAIDERNQASADEQKKILLKHDLGALNTSMAPASQACQDFQTTLQQVLGAWTTIGSNISYIATNFTEEQLQDLSTVMQALQLSQATQDWQAIATAAQEYTTNSLVSFSLQPFGSPLPPVQSQAQAA